MADTLMLHTVNMKGTSMHVDTSMQRYHSFHNLCHDVIDYIYPYLGLRTEHFQSNFYKMSIINTFSLCGRCL